jgi:hypothetical protein
MAKKAMTAISLTVCLMLGSQPVLAADSSRATEAIDAPDFTQGSPAGEAPPFVHEPGRSSAWDQPRFNEEQRDEARQPLRLPEEDEGPGGIIREEERRGLQAPPPSLQPRRNGTTDQQQPRRQLGPRRFAPTPDFNGRGSPFGFERWPPERPDPKP